MDKEGIARVFQEMAQLLALRGENPFKVRAYERAAESLLGLEEDLDTLIRENRLDEIEGVGEALAEKIATLRAGGQVRLYEELKRETPPGLIEMLRIPGLGPARIRALHQALGIVSVSELEAACRDGRVAGVKGFGPKTAEAILRSIERTRAYREGTGDQAAGRGT